MTVQSETVARGSAGSPEEPGPASVSGTLTPRHQFSPKGKASHGERCVYLPPYEAHGYAARAGPALLGPITTVDLEVLRWPDDRQPRDTKGSPGGQR